MPSKPEKRQQRPATSAQRRPSAAEVEALQHFRLIFKSVKKHFHWVEEQTGVNGAQLWALAAVVEKPGTKVTELAEALAIHQSTASNLVDKLVRQQLVRRERNAEDHRIVHLYPERDGIRLVKSAPKPVRGVLPDALSRLTGPELVRLNKLLAGIVRNMKVRDSTGRATPLSDI